MPMLRGVTVQAFINSITGTYNVGAHSFYIMENTYYDPTFANAAFNTLQNLGSVGYYIEHNNGRPDHEFWELRLYSDDGEFLCECSYFDKDLLQKDIDTAEHFYSIEFYEL